MSGLRTRVGYKTSNECVQDITASIKEPTSHLRLTGFDCRVTTGTTESNLRPQRHHWWEVGGLNPIPSECSMQGTDFNHSTWNGRNPLFLFQTVTKSGWICTSHSTRMRLQMAWGHYWPRILHDCFANTGYGANHLLFRVQGSRIRTTQAPTYSGSPGPPNVVEYWCTMPGFEPEFSLTKSWRIRVVHKGELNLRPISLTRNALPLSHIDVALLLLMLLLLLLLLFILTVIIIVVFVVFLILVSLF